MSINITIRELDAVKSRVADAQRRLSDLRDKYDARQVAQADLTGAIVRHRDVLQNADLGLADKKAVEAARAEVHALRTEANKPDVSAELAEVEAELERLKDANSAAAISVLRDLGEVALSKYRKAVAAVAEAEAILEGLKMASQDDPARLGNVVQSILASKTATVQDAEALRQVADRNRATTRDFVAAAIFGATAPALPPGVE